MLLLHTHECIYYFIKHFEQKQPAFFHFSLVFQLIVDDVSLSHSSLPNEGFVKILTKYSGNQSVCWESLKNSADDVVCRQLGYKRSASLVKQPAPSDVKDEIFSGSINCNGEENYLSQCAIDASTKSCSELSYINCKFFMFNVLQISF
jgi:hypothetical protein